MKRSKHVLLSQLTLVSIFLVVLAGGVVRMTGSGMGCPDWPKCFDCYIPPTSIKQLPSNYKDIYAAKREKKIKRFAGFLTALGFEDKAVELVEDKSLLIEQDFNAFNTWTEYINRLMGALAGMFVLAQVIIATWNIKRSKFIAMLAWALFITTMFQAWFGAMVVATNIVPWVLTIHMLLAIVMIINQLHIIKLYKVDSGEFKVESDSKIFYVSIFGSLLMIGQTVLGTQVRQEIDEVKNVLPREDWLSTMSDVFNNHQIMAILLLAVGGYLVARNIQSGIHSKTIFILGLVILLEAIVGKLFTLTGMAAILQPTHLLLSMILFSLIYYTFMSTNRSQ
ncbi:MAG: cytochrome c oxidase assembly protein subunit 15 [Parvicella sp.]|jgi:cytochrome c oxidase assembly protein subunit 15